MPSRLRWTKALCAAAFVAALVASEGHRARAAMIRDAAGRTIAVNDTRRIVSVGGSVTEILYALGLEHQVVGVDTTSLFPERALKAKPNVGYMRQLSPEGVLGLAPSLILATEGVGPKEAIAVLEAARVPFVLVPDHFTAEGILEKLHFVAAAAGAVEHGECLEKRVKVDLDALAAMRARVGAPLRVLFVLSFANGRPMVAGRATAADGIIRLAGAVNAIDEYEGYKSISDEAIVAAKPDAILVMQRNQNNLTQDDVFAHAALAMTPAAQRKRLVSMEGLYLLGFGPRTAAAARDLAGSLYPTLISDPLPSERDAEGSRDCAR
jgi:iron complex transport system substrate-binding protein